MEYSVKDQKGSVVEITVTYPFDAIEKKLEAAAQKVSEAVEIKGFRKGHAPYDKVVAQVGEQAVLEHAAEMLVKTSYTEILLKEKIEPLSQPQIRFDKLATGNEFVYVATLTRIPEVKVGDLKSIKVKEPKAEVTKEEINKVLEDLRNYSATEALTDKAAKDGDVADVNFTGYRDGVPFEGGQATNYKLNLGKKQMIPGFEEAVVGMKKGDEKEIDLNFPKDYHNAEFAGIPVTFKIKVNDVYERVLPELNDSFALLHGKKTLVELTEQIEHNLLHEAMNKQNQRVELEIIEKLIEKSTFGELPEVLVNQEIDKMFHELSMNIMQQGLTLTDYLTHIKKSEAELKLDLAPQAIQRVKAALLTRAIFIEHKMTITDEELAKEVEHYKAMYANNPSVASQLNGKEYQEMIRNMMGNNKVMNYIKAEAGIETLEHKH